MSEEDKPKRSTRQKTQYWLVRVVIVLVPAFLSYCQAKTEAESEAKSIVKKQAGHIDDKASAGYDEIAKAVKHIDEELKEYRKELYSMKGHIEAIETRLSLRIRSRPITSDPENPSTSGSAAPLPAPPDKPLDLAPSLDQAAAKHGVSKK